MKMTKVSIFLAFWALFALSGPLRADTVFYSDRFAWESNVSDIVAETYESYPWSGYEVIATESSGVTLGNITYSVKELLFPNDLHPTNPYARLIGIDSSGLPANLADAAYLSGQYIHWHSEGWFSELTITLPAATKAISFDYGSYWGINLYFNVTLNNGDSTWIWGDHDYSFFGAISDTEFSSLSVMTIICPLIDNLATANPIPEPTSLLLLGTGLAVIGLAAWRRRK